MPEIVGHTKVRVINLELLADIGINPDEVGRRQPLVLSVELTVEAHKVTVIAESVDYRKIVQAAEELASVHVPLIETFAWMLGERCLEFPRTVQVVVQVDKPLALERGLAGTEVCLRSNA